MSTPSPQRLMRLGLRDELRTELRAAEARARGLIESLQVATFLRESVADLDAERIDRHAADLGVAVRQARRLRDQIEDLDEELGA